MSVCSRCKSNNNGDIKFCNFCGARMISTMSMDCFEPSLSYHSAQAIPQLDEEPVNSKLSYRYFLKGRHAFSAGDLNRATLMFQCALDANPADSKIRAFLKRASELKTLSSDESSGNRFRPHTMSIDSLSTPTSETIDMAPLLKHQFPARTTSYKADIPLQNDRDVNNLIKGKFSALKDKSEVSGADRYLVSPMNNYQTPTALSYEVGASDKHQFPAAINDQVKSVGSYKNSKSKLSVVHDDSELLWETIPPSPAELLDSAPSSENWNDFLASVAAIAGVVLFGLVLTM